MTTRALHLPVVVALAMALAACCSRPSLSAVVGTYRTVDGHGECRGNCVYVLRADGTFLHGPVATQELPSGPVFPGSWELGCDGKVFLHFTPMHNGEIGSLSGGDYSGDFLGHGLSVILVRSGEPTRALRGPTVESFYLKVSPNVDALDGRAIGGEGVVEVPR